MQSICPLIPYDLAQFETKSFSFLFLLQELLSLLKWLEAAKKTPPQYHLFKEWQKKLERLCFYCETLLQASKVQGTSSLQSLEDMQRCKLISFSTEIKKDSLRAFFFTLFPLFEESKTNENILLSLIEHRQEWNDSLGEGIIERLFSSLFPAGPFELKAAICEGFTRRGFASFYATKESLVDTIEWDPSN
ncbi:MAG TPA: hypothetical protein VJK48_00350 [Chlamydiales bacterium]|nr:hypothetical protein [Chlamydiales bacterium]